MLVLFNVSNKFVQFLLAKVTESTVSGMYKWKFNQGTTLTATSTYIKDNADWSQNGSVMSFDYSLFDSIVIKWSNLYKTNTSGSPGGMLYFYWEWETYSNAFYSTPAVIYTGSDNTPVTLTLSNSSNQNIFKGGKINYTVSVNTGSASNKFYISAQWFSAIWYKLKYKPSIKVYDNKNIWQKLTGYLYWVLPDGTRWNWNQ